MTVSLAARLYRQAPTLTDNNSILPLLCPMGRRALLFPLRRCSTKTPSCFLVFLLWLLLSDVVVAPPPPLTPSPQATQIDTCSFYSETACPGRTLCTSDTIMHGSLQDCLNSFCSYNDYVPQCSWENGQCKSCIVPCSGYCLATIFSNCTDTV